MSTNTTAPAPATLAHLHHLLDAGQALAATYRGRMSNHLPMAQQALLELGVSAERLHAFTEAHEAGLEPCTAARPARVVLERDLGRVDSDAAWRAHFARRIAELGAPQALREALALLLPGAGAIAFHGLIRTAHGALAGHEGELASGLAHWASQFMLLADAGGSPMSLAEWAEALLQLPRPTYPAGSFIADRMQAWRLGHRWPDPAWRRAVERAIHFDGGCIPVNWNAWKATSPN